jgi:hypothetical protein
MPGDVSIDLGSALPYYTERILGLFGRDATTQEALRQILQQQRIAAQQASLIQCVGMAQPITIQSIYQSTKLVSSHDEHRADTLGRSNLWELLKAEESAIVFAGPGCGKTTLLHWFYINLLQDRTTTPLLFTLRLSNGVESLLTFVTNAELGLTSRVTKKSRAVVLVDGYDEVTAEERKHVSEALLRFTALNIGPFYLTCRTFYDVFELKVRRFQIEPFGDEESIGFIQAFAGAYKAKIDASQFLLELKARRFSDFASHPLMLALICILKTGPLETIPSNSIGLLRRALDTLTLRWDQAKAINRETVLPLDGEERVRCMMRIAFHFKSSEEREEVIVPHVEEQLRLSQHRYVDARRLLLEMAQWGMYQVNESWVRFGDVLCDSM